MTTPRRLALRGDLLDFCGTPAFADTQPAALRWRPDHWLLIEDGRICGAQPQAPGPDWALHDHAGQLILPGFIDSHVHSAQIDVIGAWGSSLLDWLQTHTYPAEQRMADAAHAQAISALFLDALLARGSTAACVFPTVHAASVDALFEAAQARGMRLIAGKVLMDRHAPAALCDAADSVEPARAQCLALIERWHGRGRAAYAVTPRFAPTSSAAQLVMAAELLRSAPGLYLQTHLAETEEERAWVAALFPQARSYLDVYAQHGLLQGRALLAHGIWLDDADRRLLHTTGSTLVHCPSSNQFLGSGAFDWPAAQAAGAAVSLASDVGGGNSLSMRRCLLDAYKVQIGQGHRLSAWALLHAATRGAAKALQLEQEIGSFEPGTLADLCIWDWASNPLAARRQASAGSLHNKVFAWITQGDEADLAQTWVAGICRYRRGDDVHSPVAR